MLQLKSQVTEGKCFFFSSRRRHTRCLSDWSSDVCSSDLILISNTYYPALAQDNVEVITDGIAEVTPTGIVDRNGVEREIDVLVVATGFFPTDQPIAHHITGREGRTLGDGWAEN